MANLDEERDQNEGKYQGLNPPPPAAPTGHPQQPLTLQFFAAITFHCVLEEINDEFIG